MAQEDQIAQVLGVLPSLSPEQIDSLNKFDTAPLDAALEAAEANFGYEADRHLSPVNGSYVSIGVLQLARTAILGILSDDATLTAPWTGIVGDFAKEEAEIEAGVQAAEVVAQAKDPSAVVVKDAPNDYDFTATLASQDGSEARVVHLLKLVKLDDPTYEAYLEVGTNDVWLPEQLAGITPYAVPSADPSAGAI